MGGDTEAQSCASILDVVAAGGEGEHEACRGEAYADPVDEAQAGHRVPRSQKLAAPCH